MNEMRNGFTLMFIIPQKGQNEKQLQLFYQEKKADTFSLFLGIKTTLGNGDRKQSPDTRIREI